jgi:inosine-uridine nucleoside N-ribohydrolase
MTRAEKPVASAGAEKIVELALEAKRDNEQLYIIGIAAATDIASALLMAPEIAGSVTVCWLGGHPAGPWKNDEFNLAQDYLASQHLFASKAALIQFPCRNVAQMLSLSRYELEARYNGSDILDYLRERTIAEMELCGNTTRPIWDVAPVAWLLDEKPFISSVSETPHLELNGDEIPRKDSPLFRRIASLRRDPIMEQLISILKRA